MSPNIPQTYIIYSNVTGKPATEVEFIERLKRFSSSALLNGASIGNDGRILVAFFGTFSRTTMKLIARRRLSYVAPSKLSRQCGWCRGRDMHHASNQISGILGNLRSSEGSGSESSRNPDLALKIMLANPSVNREDRTDADPGEFDKHWYRMLFLGVMWCWNQVSHRRFVTSA